MDRKRMLAAIDRIPWWKRWLICEVFRREQARIARAYSAVAAHGAQRAG